MPLNRISFTGGGTAGGGGGGPTTTAFLDWGPDFGEGAGNDDETWLTGLQQRPIEEIGLTNDAFLGSALDLQALDLRGDHGTGVVHDLQRLGLAGTTGTGWKLGESDVLALNDEYSIVQIDYMHWAKSVQLTSSGDDYGFVNPNEDNPSTTNFAVASRANDTYFRQGFPFTIQPETVPGVSGDEQVALWKFATFNTQTEAEYLIPEGVARPGRVNMTNVSIYFSAEFTNPAAATDANITCQFYRSPNNPWTNSTANWNGNGGQPSGSVFRTQTLPLLASSTATLTFFSTNIIPSVLNNNWIWVRLTSSLTGALGPVEVNVRHDSLRPNDQPGSGGDYKAGILGFVGMLT